MSEKEYKEIMRECYDAIAQTKQEVSRYKSKDVDTRVFLDELVSCWVEEII